MSRSYKKTPYCGLPKDKTFKRYANRKFRRKKLTADLQHKSYRKDFCSYDICDYYEVGTTFEHFWSCQVRRWNDWGKWYNKPYPDYDECYQYWQSWYKRK